jgi:hypothetical protein
MGNGDQVPVTKQGDIIFREKSMGQHILIHVMACADFPKNILTAKKLLAKGHSMTFNVHKGCIEAKVKVTGKTTKLGLPKNDDSVYYMCGTQVNKKEAKVFATERKMETAQRKTNCDRVCFRAINGHLQVPAPDHKSHSHVKRCQMATLHLIGSQEGHGHFVQDLELSGLPMGLDNSETVYLAPEQGGPAQNLITDEADTNLEAGRMLEQGALNISDAIDLIAMKVTVKNRATKSDGLRWKNRLKRARD